MFMTHQLPFAIAQFHLEGQLVVLFAIGSNNHLYSGLIGAELGGMNKGLPRIDI